MAYIDGKYSHSISQGLSRRSADMKSKASEESKKVPESVHTKADQPKDSEGATSHDHEGMEGEHDVIKGIFAKHGPAEKTEVKHDGGAGHHTVKTTHEDGHEHESKGHPSVGHVSEHLAAAVGKEGSPVTGEADQSAEKSPLSAMGMGAEGPEAD
jgi:hypothetical protein